MVKSNDSPCDPELVRFLHQELGEPPCAGAGLQFTGPLWLWRGQRKDGMPTKTAWHFVTIDGDVAVAIRAASHGPGATRRSVCVRVTIGTTQWRTSVFPSQSVGGYLLPVKTSVRKAQGLCEGDVVTLFLAL